jgi:hypothetical protein
VRAGHRITGVAGKRQAGYHRKKFSAGWEFCHVAIDDATRLAYVEVLADEKAATAVGFLRRAKAFFESYGMTVESAMTDNGGAYRSTIHAIACKTLGLKHLRTRPYRPQTNGKAERFIRTMLGGWAYGAIYTNSSDRAAALDGWLFTYNHRRRHAGINRQTPIQQLNNLLGTYTRLSPKRCWCRAVPLGGPRIGWFVVTRCSRRRVPHPRARGCVAAGVLAPEASRPPVDCSVGRERARLLTVARCQVDCDVAGSGTPDGRCAVRQGYLALTAADGKRCICARFAGFSRRAGSLPRGRPSQYWGLAVDRVEWLGCTWLGPSIPVSRRTRRFLMKQLPKRSVLLFGAVLAVCAFAAPMASAASWSVVGTNHTLASPNLAFSQAVGGGLTIGAICTSSIDATVTSAAELTIDGMTFTNCRGTSVATGCTATITGTNFPWSATALTTTSITIHGFHLDLRFETAPGGAACNSLVHNQNFNLTGNLTGGVADPSSIGANRRITFTNASGLVSHSALANGAPTLVNGTFSDPAGTLNILD